MNLLIIQFILLLSTALFAIFCGDWPERCVSFSFLTVLVVDQLAHALPVNGRIDFELWHLFLDASLMGIVIFVAIKADRFWPLFVASSQSIAAIAGILNFVGFGSQPLVWAILVRVPTWLAIVLTFFGTLSQLLERRLRQKL